jgi:hypothetical protein
MLATMMEKALQMMIFQTALHSHAVAKVVGTAE